MPPTAVRRGSLALTLVAGLLTSLLLATLLLVTSTGPARAADDKGLVHGQIRFPQEDSPRLKLLWFDGSWNYLGQRSAGGNGYSLWLAPGTYHLQLVDQRPSYDVEKYAPTDVRVTVRAQDFTTRNITMRRGAAITGTARGGGKPLGGARIVAARPDGQSFATIADPNGEFAVGGLPQGRYSLFTYDRRAAWVGKSTWAGGMKPGQDRSLAVRLPTRAGDLTVYLFTPEGRLRTRGTVTVISKANGQWWTTDARNGTAVFRGLYPGRYTLKFDGAGVWFARTAPVQRATVRSGAMAFGRFQLTERGGWVTGTVVDGGDADAPMAAVPVRLFDQHGSEVASTTSGPDGEFTLEGRLATQTGMTIVVAPKPDTGGWMQGGEWCRFTEGSLSPVGVTAGEETWVGAVGLPRAADREQRAACTNDDPDGRRRAPRERPSRR